MRYISKGIYFNGKMLYDFGFEIELGRFVRILPNEELKGNGNVISLDGFVYPAFIESHAHIGEVHNMLEFINGEGFNENTLWDVVKKEKRAYIFNVDFNKIPLETFRELFYFDRVIFIQSKDEHSVFVSKKLLEEIGLRVEAIDRDTLGFLNGEFIGIFKDSAISYVKDVVKINPTEESLKKVEDYFLSRGIVSITNFDFYFMKFIKRENSRIRVIQGIKLEALDEMISSQVKTSLGDDDFIYGPVKVFLDGSLGSQTAAMIDCKPFKGILLMDEKAFEEIVRKANTHGIFVAVHAIGSKAVHIALSTFNKLQHLSTLNRIEHLQFIDERDIDLLKATKFIPSMQPIHAISDEYLYKKYMGNFRFAYALNTVYRSKGFIILGSDAPVEDASVLKGIHASINRPFLQEESLPLEIAIKGYTEFGGIYNYAKDRGKIEKGYLGDFVVLKNPIKEDNILENSVILTAKGGNIVWTK